MSILFESYTFSFSDTADEKRLRRSRRLFDEGGEGSADSDSHILPSLKYLCTRTAPLLQSKGTHSSPSVHAGRETRHNSRRATALFKDADDADHYDYATIAQSNSIFLPERAMSLSSCHDRHNSASKSLEDNFLVPLDPKKPTSCQRRSVSTAVIR